MSDIRIESAIEPLAAEWEELADRTGAPPFLRPGWAQAWWRAFGTGTPAILTLRRDGGLAALLALHRPARRASAFKTEPLPLSSRPKTLRAMANWHVPVYAPLAEDPEAVAELSDALISRGESLVSLAILDPREPFLDGVHGAAEQAGYRIVSRRLGPSPYVDVDGDWAAYARQRPAKLLSDVRRRERRLREIGEVEIQVADGSGGTAALLEEGLALEPSGWKAARGSAIASRQETRRFYEDIAEWAADRGWLRFAFLRLDGRPLAFEFGLEHGGTYFFLKGGYDPEYHRYAPGKILVHAMLKRAFAEGLTRFDFLGGDEAWKLDWTDTCRERIVLHACAPSALGRAEWIAVAHGRPMRARVRARLRPLAPRLESLRP
ncbi:MAG TPA: GNAT family N-acetyltransferase [Solirubrobacteraceae bacterium]|nr:GNAT family N-acetyltransferase [Solirubrobacteraceae bacterium]